MVRWEFWACPHGDLGLPFKLVMREFETLNDATRLHQALQCLSPIEHLASLDFLHESAYREIANS
jgi:hypothetical protein